MNGCIFCHNNAQTSSDYLGKCECINDLLLSAPWNDYHGNYCGAKRVNGNLSPNGQDGMSSRDIGNVKPVDELDSCCMRHDQCLADVDNNPALTRAERNLAIKSCDAKIAACWIKAQITDKDASCMARAKGLVGSLVMPVFAHVLNPFPMEQNDGTVGVGIIGVTF